VSTYPAAIGVSDDVLTGVGLMAIRFISCRWLGSTMTGLWIRDMGSVYGLASGVGHVICMDGFACLCGYIDRLW
jgi:hypothetical protein